MKSIKEIDLLNKIANGEKIPKKIKTPSGLELTYDEDLKNYFDEDFDITLFDKDVGQELDLELEIIEEDKKIETIEEPRFNKGKYYIKGIRGNDSEISDIERIFRLKINEIIDHINKEKK